MTRDEARQMMPIIQAFAEGKVIQTQYSSQHEWLDCINNMVFNSPPECYRIKPEPTYRPWKPNEVPVGAIVKRKNVTNSDAFLITGRSSIYTQAVAYIDVLFPRPVIESNTHILLNEYEYSTDQGKTWLPCGVLE